MVLLLAVLALLSIVTHYRAKAAAEAYTQQLRDQGEKLTFEELIPSVETKSREAATDLLAAARGLPALIYRYGSVARPFGMHLLAPGHALIAWAQEALPMEGNTNIWPTLHQMQADATALAAARELLKNGDLDFNVDYRDLDYQRPHWERMQTIALGFSDSATLALHERRADAAWADIRANTALMKAWKDERLVVSRGFRRRIAAIGFANTWEALHCFQLRHGKLPSELAALVPEFLPALPHDW